MKKSFFNIVCIMIFPLLLSGCRTVGEKSASLSIIYGVCAVLSLLLLIGCYFLVQKKRTWFLILFSSVFAVNAGYTLLSVSTTLEMALNANRIAYFGSVFLPFSMLMILLNVTHIKYSKLHSVLLLALAIVMFLIAGSPGINNLYYKDVTFELQNGVSSLEKVYGPLHPLYLIYLLGYFSTMVVIVLRGIIRKTIVSVSHSIVLVIAVFVNIGVWAIEQIFEIDFEMLAVSYIISELFLLGIHLVMSEMQILREIANRVETVQQFSDAPSTDVDNMLHTPIEKTAIDFYRFDLFLEGIKQLTPTEKAIYDAHLARVTSKEIMANLNIKENTLKYHNRNLYGKLGISSKKELLEIHKQLSAAKEKLCR